MQLPGLKWGVAVLAAVISAAAIACSGEPEVVEVEVTREVVITATPVPTAMPTVASATATAAPTPTAEPTVAPTRVSKDYYVIIQIHSYGGEFEYIVDFTPEDNYTEMGMGPSQDFSNPELFLDYLLEEGTITPEQRRVADRGNSIEVPYDELSVAVYKLLQSEGRSYLRNQFGINKIRLDYLLYHFGESLLDSDSDDREPGSRALPSNHSFNAASLLARFSTTDAAEGEARSGAVGEIVALYRSGRAESGRILTLLDTAAPELSIAQRRQSSDKLAGISADGQWDFDDTDQGVFYLATLITGDEPNPGERIEAAHELAILYEAGELDASNALDLMDTIAPSLFIDQRRQAAAMLAELSADSGWDSADRMAAASEVFRLVTGVPLEAEARLGAAVDLAGVGARIFDTEGRFDDGDISAATALIKQALTGELTAESRASWRAAHER